MSEFIVSARLIADASGLKAGAAEGKRAIADIGTESRTSAAGAQVLKSAIDEVNRATHPATGSTQALKTALASAKAEFDAGRLSANAYAKVMEVAGRATREAARFAGSQVTSLGQQQNAYRQLGFQVGDVSQQLALGINPAVVFAQQIGQITQAVSMLGSKMGGFSAFLAGPWGAAVTGAVIVLGLLASSFFKSSDAEEDASKATDVHSLSAKDLTKAIGELDAALAKQTETTIQSESASYRAAQRLVEEAQNRRKVAAAALEQAKAELVLAAARASDPTLAQEGGFNPGAAAAALMAERVRELDAQIQQLNKEIEAGSQAQRRAGGAIIERGIKERLDAATAATGRFERAQGRLRRELEQGIITGREFDRQLSEAARRRDREVKAAQDAARRTRSSTSENRQTGRDLSEAEARALVRSIGGTPTSGTRSAEYNRRVGGATNSYHLVGQALDIAKTAGLTLGKIRKAFTDAGVSIRELIDEGDHFHVAWSRSASTTKAMAEAAREAAAAQRELLQDLGAIITQFDPARAAAEKYGDTLERIDRLYKANMITTGQWIQYGAKAAADEWERLKKEASEAAAAQARAMGFDPYPMLEYRPTHNVENSLETNITQVMEGAGRRGGEAFRSSGLEAAEAIANLFGGKIGGVVGDVFGALSGARTGNFNSLGKAGNVLTLLASKPKPGEPVGPFMQGLREFIDPLRKGFKDVIGKLGDIFKIGGDFEKTLGHAAGGAALGSVFGPAVTNLLGIKGSGTGGAIGGALGSVAGEVLKGTITKAIGGALGKAIGGAAGPIGSLVGSALGSALGGLLKKSKTGSATITSADGGIVTGGNTADFKAASSGLAKNVQGGLNQIAEALGGTLGAFAVSIGIKDGNLRLDRTGKGIVKTKKGAIDFGKDEAGITAAAIADAIADGAVIGLSAAVQRALKSSPDIDRALREALKVDEVETLLAGLGGTMSKQFRDFERQAAERVRIAKQYGFDVLKVEELNAKDRVKLTDDILGSRVGALKDLLDDLKFGDLFEGSLTDQRDKLLVEIARVQADAGAGSEGAADKLADLNRRLIELSRSAFGTAGGEFAADRAQAISSAERIIELENQRIKAAQEAQKETNTHLDEANTHLATHTTVLRGIAGSLSALEAMATRGGGLSAINTAFTADLK